ncbi:MAG TPA: hypothetical protein VJ901_20410, partial [Thermoanaerobaculia bacterium]|nr:hypothetical protein [Thermoanaerobaculia bacterium]
DRAATHPGPSTTLGMTLQVHRGSRKAITAPTPNTMPSIVSEVRSLCLPRLMTAPVKADMTSSRA